MEMKICPPYVSERRLSSSISRENNAFLQVEKNLAATSADAPAAWFGPCLTVRVERKKEGETFVHNAKQLKEKSLRSAGQKKKFPYSFVADAAARKSAKKPGRKKYCLAGPSKLYSYPGFKWIAWN